MAVKIWLLNLRSILLFHIGNQAVCVTRFGQSECVIYRVIFTLGKSRYQRCIWWNFRFIPSGKLLELFILIIYSYVTFKYFAFLNVCDKFELLMSRPPWWFECYFCRSSWIHCWLLLAVLWDYFGHLVTSIFLLCKFRGLPGSTRVYPGLPLLVFPLWDVASALEWRDRLSQVA